ncbi:MAG: hypothetical protein JNK85_12290 [Verrucomicrobiales bacterium]|nr:hypothetical protein [Verrucomicrobiales bacterium]
MISEGLVTRFVFITGWTLLGFLPIRAASYLAVQGEMIVEFQLEGNPDARRSETLPFACTVGGGEWWIDAKESVNGQDRWHFDGVYLYHSTRIVGWTPEKAQNALGQRASVVEAGLASDASSNVTVNVWSPSNGQPLGSMAVNVPWLALASGDFLKLPDRVIPLPCDRLQNTPDRFAYTDETKTFEDQVGRPRRVELRLSRQRWHASARQFYTEMGTLDRYGPWVEQVAEKLEEGTPKFRYEVLTSTNFLGQTVPLEFKFRQEGRDFIPVGNFTVTGSGRVSDIREVEKPGTLFDPTLKITIVDWRFRDEGSRVQPLIYTTTNATVALTNNVRLQEKLRKTIEKHRQSQREPGNPAPSNEPMPR